MTTVQANLPWAFVAIATFVFGCMIGSFLNVVIYRLPREESIVFPGSHCPQCDHSLSWYENIPLFSYAVQGGKCRHCKGDISWRYPAIEALTGVLWAAIALHVGLDPLRFVAEAALVSALVAIFWIDLDTMLILDVITLPGTALGLVVRGPIEQGLAWRLWMPYVAAAAGGYLFFRLIEWGSEKVLGVPGMGRGDAKLAALMGAWLGPAGLVVGLMISFTLGSVVGLVLRARKGESEPFPFGPAMVMGALASVFAGQAVWLWYLHLVTG